MSWKSPRNDRLTNGLNDVVDIADRMVRTLASDKFQRYDDQRFAADVLGILARRTQAACHSYVVLLSLSESIRTAGKSSGRLNVSESLITDTRLRSAHWTIRCTDCADRYVEFERSVCSLAVQISAALEVLPIVVDYLLNLEDRRKDEQGILTKSTTRPTKKVGSLFKWLREELDRVSARSKLMVAKSLLGLVSRHLPEEDDVVAGGEHAWFWVLRGLRLHLIHHPKSNLIKWRDDLSSFWINVDSKHLPNVQDPRRELLPFLGWVWGTQPGALGFIPLVHGTVSLLGDALFGADSLPLR